MGKSILEQTVEEFPVGCKVGKAGTYSSNIFDYVDFAYVIGYEGDDDNVWLLVYHEKWGGHSGHYGVLTHNLKKYTEIELEKKYGKHCWWVETRNVKRLRD